MCYSGLLGLETAARHSELQVDTNVILGEMEPVIEQTMIDIDLKKSVTSLVLLTQKYDAAYMS